MYTKAPLIRKQHLWVTAFEDVCCNVWTVCIFSGHNQNLQHHLSYPVVSLSGALHLWQRNVARVALALGWPQRKLEVPSPRPRLFFSEGSCHCRGFCSQSAGCLHVMENCIWGGKKKKVLQCSSPSESLALLSCHGGWWLIADKVLLGCRRLEVPADCQWGQLVMEVVWARDEKSRWPDTMWSRLHERHRAWHRTRYTVKTLDLFGPLCRLIFASVWNYFWNKFLKWGVVLG